MTIEAQKKVVRDDAVGAANTFITAVPMQGEFNIDISGTWDGTITVQRKFPDAMYSGTATNAAPGATLEDTAQTWTADELIGMYIYNETTGAQGLLTDNTATVITGPVAGGTGTNFTLGDVYSIWRDVPSGVFTGNADRVGKEVDQGVLYRAGFKAGDWTSGTANIRISK